MAICLVVGSQDRLVFGGQVTGDPLQICDAYALDPGEVAYLANADAVGAFYAPIPPADFAAFASGAAVPVLVAFLSAYFVGTLVSMFRD